MRLPLLILAFLAAFGSNAYTQQLPNTAVYLFDMEQETDSVYRFEKPRYLTAFNPDGYNNQPSFVNDHEIYLTVQMADDTTQTDIYSLNLETMIKTQVTATPDSEYSPLLKPGTDEDIVQTFSCVRVENDGEATQRVWEFPIDRSDNGQPAFKSVTDVGYHIWLSYKRAALFIVGDPHRLVLATSGRDKVDNITANIGRCFQSMPDGSLVFVHKLSDRTWLLKKLNTNTNRPELITATPKQKEDFVILPDGTFLIGSGSKLFKFNQEKDNSWIEVADFKYYGINNITRMAVRDGKQIVIISKR